MQQMLNSIPSRKIHIPLCDTFLNINAKEELLLRKELEKKPISILYKGYKFITIFFLVVHLLIMFLFWTHVAGLKNLEETPGWFAFKLMLAWAFTMSVSLLISQSLEFYIDLYKKYYFSNFSGKQRKAIEFLDSVDNVSELFYEIETIKIKESLVDYNNYHNKLKKLNKIVSPDKVSEPLRKYIFAQVLINLTEEDVARSYVKDAADYFIETPVDKLELSPRADIVFSIESKAYGKAISPLAKKYQSSIR